MNIFTKIKQVLQTSQHKEYKVIFYNKIPFAICKDTKYWHIAYYYNNSYPLTSFIIGQSRRRCIQKLKSLQKEDEAFLLIRSRGKKFPNTIYIGI